jgi:DNA topoisomerase VI subunit A
LVNNWLFENSDYKKMKYVEKQKIVFYLENMILNMVQDLVKNQEVYFEFPIRNKENSIINEDQILLKKPTTTCKKIKFKNISQIRNFSFIFFNNFRLYCEYDSNYFRNY